MDRVVCGEGARSYAKRFAVPVRARRQEFARPRRGHPPVEGRRPSQRPRPARRFPSSRRGARILKPEDRDAGRAKRRISPPPANNPEYEAWRDGLPESLAGSRTAELLEGVCDVDLDTLDVKLPRGFGRD